MAAYAELKTRLRAEPRTWLVTGAAGFIGSALTERLLELDQRVVGLDNLLTGRMRNLADVEQRVTPAQWQRFRFVQGDIRHFDDCVGAVQGVDSVLHQAALGSVPRSIADPRLTNDCNVSGFLNVLVAARDAGVRRFVYAASSSTYGDHPGLPKVEDRIGRPLSPYAVTKYVNELYAEVFHRSYGMSTVGLRYFNVYGRRQDENSTYAAVIPIWFHSLLTGQPVFINGDGESSRDFCHVDDAVQANLLAACAGDAASGSVYNVAVGERTTLNQLFAEIRARVARVQPEVAQAQPTYREFRAGDVRHSLADITRARTELGYEPALRVATGLDEAAAWYLSAHRP
jgi:UDP-N-acetylglucosamine 4-epimerase